MVVIAFDSSVGIAQLVQLLFEGFLSININVCRIYVFLQIYRITAGYLLSFCLGKTKIKTGKIDKRKLNIIKMQWNENLLQLSFPLQNLEQRIMKMLKKYIKIKTKILFPF